jgi:rubrerythrin
MAAKPSYLKLLNGISCAETRAYQYLSAWADTTTDLEVRAVLRTVAAREGEHGMAFAKRINELGFDVKPTDDPKFAERMEIAGSDRSDLEKAELLGLLEFATAPDTPDIFDSFFRDHSIDIQTGGLLGRYIAEERDTLRLLQGCRAQLAEKACDTPESSDRLAALEGKIDAACRAVEELRQTVCAQTMPAPSSSR